MQIGLEIIRITLAAVALALSGLSLWVGLHWRRYFPALDLSDSASRGFFRCLLAFFLVAYMGLCVALVVNTFVGYGLWAGATIVAILLPGLVYNSRSCGDARRQTQTPPAAQVEGVSENDVDDP